MTTWAPMWMVVPKGTEVGHIIVRDTGYHIFPSRYEASDQALYDAPGALVAQIDPINRNGALAFVACHVSEPDTKHSEPTND